MGRAGSCELTGDLVSAGDIGGQMGLFIGASLLTILEILDFLCEVGLGPDWGRGHKSSHRIPDLTTACPQVFRDRVLGYFWKRKRSQRHSSTNLVTAP